MKINGSSKNFFSGRIICESCKEPFTRKVWHSTTKYRRHIWQCGQKYAGSKPCSTPHFTEDEITHAFEQVVMILLCNRNDVISLCKRTLEEILDTTKDIETVQKLEMKLEKCYAELSEKLRSMGRMINNSDTAHEEYNCELEIYEKESRKLADLKSLIANKEVVSNKVCNFGTPCLTVPTCWLS